ncbi:hypothetical protein VTK56DRAFT_5629 [Thermocarpiscus australiensis]
MVYCGRPSRGCQMCRMRRIKCDETKPTCNQCAKARRQCPGYRDEFDLVLRNENLAARRRALKGTASGSSKKSALTPSPTTTIPAPPVPRASNGITTKPKSNPAAEAIPPTLHIPPEEQARCHFLSNFVLVPRQGSTRGFMEYLIPLMEETTTRTTATTTTVTDGAAAAAQAHLQHAFNACALASWGNRILGRGGGGGGGSAKGGGGGGGGGDGGWYLGRAYAEYARALRATQAALRDAEQARSDGVLAAVLLLGMFENMTAKQPGDLAWGSHILGAIQLVKARGRGQLRTKLGLQLFIAVRTQLIIHTLTSGNAPDMGVDWWIHDAVLDTTAATCQRLNLLTAELRAEATRIMTSAARTPETIKLVQDLMRRAQAVDREITAWMRSVPNGWQFKTLCWQDRHAALPGGSGSDYSQAEVFPGRVDVYNDFWIAAVWNMARTARLILMSITVRCAAWACSPVDYRTTPEYATAARCCVDMIADILASAPYHLGWHTKRTDLFSSQEEESSGFACGEDDAVKGLAAFFLTWPLACVMTQDYATDAQRAYVKGRLKYIGDELGIKYAHILSQLPVRVPSMLIRSDGLLAKPCPMAHNFEKLLSLSPQTPPYSEGCIMKPAAAAAAGSYAAAGPV